MPITPRKLATLKPQSQLRKGARIFAAAELDLREAKSVDVDYLISIAAVLIVESSPISAEGRGELESIHRRMAAWRAQTATTGSTEPEADTPGKGGPAAGVPELRRLLNGARHLLYAETGESPAEWDLLPRTDVTSMADAEGVAPFAEGVDPVRPPSFRAQESALSGCSLYLDDVRSPFNVGSIIRTAEALGLGAVYLSPATPGPDHPRVKRTGRGAEERMAVRRLQDSSRLDGAARLFALETGGTPIGEFVFPQEGMMVVGSEELGVEPDLLARCRRGRGVVELPMAGPKVSVNVSVAVGIALYEWARAATLPATTRAKAGDSGTAMGARGTAAGPRDE